MISNQNNKIEKNKRVYLIIKNILFFIVIGLSFNGCIFTLGDNVGMCERGGCNYKEAGVCTDLITTYKNKNLLRNKIVIEKEGWFD